MNFQKFDHFFLPYQKNGIHVNVSIIQENENALLYYLRNIKDIKKDEKILNYLIENSDLTIRNKEGLNPLEFVLVNNRKINIYSSSLTLLIDKSPSENGLILTWFNQKNEKLNLTKKNWTTLINSSKLKTNFADQEILVLVALLAIEIDAKKFNQEHLNILYKRTKDIFNPFMELSSCVLAPPTKKKIYEKLQNLEIIYNYKHLIKINNPNIENNNTFQRIKI